MKNSNESGFVKFLTEYIGGDRDFRRNNHHVLEGLDILSRLEDSYERGRMTASSVRQDIQTALTQPRKPSWSIEAGRAVEAFLSASGARSADNHGSYAWLWREAMRLLEDDTDGDGS